MHPDFEQIRADEFHSWAESQPEAIKDGFMVMLQMQTCFESNRLFKQIPASQNLNQNYLAI